MFASLRSTLISPKAPSLVWTLRFVGCCNASLKTKMRKSNKYYSIHSIRFLINFYLISNLSRDTLSIGSYSEFHRTCIRVSQTGHRQRWTISWTISLKTTSHFSTNERISLRMLSPLLNWLASLPRRIIPACGTQVARYAVSFIGDAARLSWSTCFTRRSQVSWKIYSIRFLHWG